MRPVFLLVLALLIAGCGGSSGSDAPQSGDGLQGIILSHGSYPGLDHSLGLLSEDKSGRLVSFTRTGSEQALKPGQRVSLQGKLVSESDRTAAFEAVGDADVNGDIGSEEFYARKAVANGFQYPNGRSLFALTAVGPGGSLGMPVAVWFDKSQYPQLEQASMKVQTAQAGQTTSSKSPPIPSADFLLKFEDGELTLVAVENIEAP